MIQAKTRSEILAQIGKLHGQIEHRLVKVGKEHPVYGLMPESHLIEMLGLLATAVLLNTEVRLRS